MTDDLECLSKRERQIMDIVYSRGRASVSDVIGLLLDPPSYNAVRTLMAILERKELLVHEQIGQRYVFLPAVPLNEARRSALSRVLRIFFGGSVEAAVKALLDTEPVGTDDLRRIEDQIRTRRGQPV